MIMFGSFLPGLGWLAPPKSTRASEPTLLWNQLRSKPLNESYPRGYNSDAHSPAASKWQPVHLNNHPA
jgi:hypothetical protein